MNLSLFSLTVVNWTNVTNHLGGNPQNIDSDPLAVIKFLKRDELKDHLVVGILSMCEDQEPLIRLLAPFQVTILPMEKSIVLSATLREWERVVVICSRKKGLGREFANYIYNGFRSLKMDLWINYRKNILGKEVEFANHS